MQVITGTDTKRQTSERMSHSSYHISLVDKRLLAKEEEEEEEEDENQKKKNTHKTLNETRRQKSERQNSRQ